VIIFKITAKLRIYRQCLRNELLSTSCGPKGLEVNGGKRKLHIEEFIIFPFHRMTRTKKPKRKRLEMHLARMEEIRNEYKILIRKSEGKRFYGRHRQG
jgi:hypothetical protein